MTDPAAGPNPAIEAELRELFAARTRTITMTGAPMTEIAYRAAARSQRRHALTAVMASVAAAAAVLAFVFVGPALWNAETDRGLPADSEDPLKSVTAVREPDRSEVSTIPLPFTDAGGAFVGFNHVFVRSRQDPAVIAKVNPQSNRVVDELTLPPGGLLPDGLTPVAADGSLWWPGQNRVFRIDPHLLTVLATIPVQRQDPALATDGTRVWALTSDHEVAEIDTSTNRYRDGQPLEIPPSALAYADGFLWVGAENAVRLLYPDDLLLERRVPLLDRIGGLLTVGRSVWAGLPDSDRLARISANGEVRTVALGHGENEFDPQLAMNSDGDTVWAMTGRNQLVAVDSDSARVTDRVHIYDSAYHSEVAVTGNTVWVPVRQRAELIRFDWRQD